MGPLPLTGQRVTRLVLVQAVLVLTGDRVPRAAFCDSRAGAGIHHVRGSAAGTLPAEAGSPVWQPRAPAPRVPVQPSLSMKQASATEH